MPLQGATQRLVALYDGLIINRPAAALALLLAIAAFLGWFAPQLRIDISGDSLVLENDADLRYYRAIRARYGSDSFLIVTYSPKRPLFSDAALADLQRLRDRLAAIDGVDSVVSPLDVPLTQSPPMTLEQLQEGVRTLMSPETDRALAKVELSQSPLYGNRLVGADGDVAAIQVNLQRDARYLELRRDRDALREKGLEHELTPAEAASLDRLSREFKEHAADATDREAALIARVRAVMDQHREGATLHLGGAPMIVADMMDYVRRDVRVFGLGVILLVALLLWIAFKQIRWVLLPLFTALAAGVMTVGALALTGNQVTVVSSNFLSLLLIFTLSLTIHLIVRYRELQRNHPEAESRFLTREMAHSKAVPCIYMVVTTMAAFGSLVVSGIRPVIDFGWIMAISLTVALVINFTLFPAAVALLKPKHPGEARDMSDVITALFPPLIERHGRALLGTVAVAVGLGLAGLSALTVENRFIDHFKSDTEIHRGMALIDRKLGGTTPLEVVIDAPKAVETEKEAPPEADGEDDFLFDLMEEEEGGAGLTGESHWFNVFMADRVAAIHRSLESRRETGKVISLASTLETLKGINGGELQDNFTLSLLYERLPDEVKAGLFTPYLSADGDQLRFSIRVYESDPTLRRQALLETIRHELTETLGLADDQVHLTGMLVLYNNMLQSLFTSQILTLGAVFLAILIMFTLLFRSFKVALIALVPNLIAAPLVLGLMGGLGIPLDIMTITIAALSIGIGVDDTIHYVHRFSEEIVRDFDYPAAVRRAHGSIGKAMYYTTITITAGFSVLALSQFVPTIWFGLLTAFSMLVALLANLTVLPLLLEKLKPYGS